jgi:hypothetical protein
MTAEAVAETQVATPDEAIGSTSEEASSQETEGTTDNAATVRSEEEGQSEGELRYSESSLVAERDAAREEGRLTALREREETTRERRKQLAAAIAETAGPSSVITSAKKAMQSTLSESLTDADMEPVLKVIRDARSTIEEAAFVVAANAYESAINSGFENDADSKAFWERAAGLDPALDAATVLPLYAEQKALDTKAVKEADPELLLKANPKLRAYVTKAGDERYRVGRDQGRKDPRGEAGTAGESVAPTGNRLTVAESSHLPILELMQRRRGA